MLADSIDNVRQEVWTPDRYVSDNLADGVGAVMPSYSSLQILGKDAAPIKMHARGDQIRYIGHQGAFDIDGPLTVPLGENPDPTEPTEPFDGA